MRFTRHLALLSVPFLLAATTAVCAQSPLPAPSSAESLFKERPFGPLPPPTASPSPKHFASEDEKPIPASWWIGGIAGVVVAAAGVLYGAARAWHSSNLFGRQYRFPEGGEAALRFGAMRSGGHMASIRFGEGRPVSKTKDT